MTVVAAAVALLLLGPLMGVDVPGGLVRPFRSRISRAQPRDVIGDAAALLVLVSTGTPVVAALEEMAAEDAHILAVVRQARRLGSGPALASATGPLAPLLHWLADATVSGAPPEPAIRAFIQTERRRRHTEAIERGRRLPVRLMVPMTLLVLPGFVLMVYGPALLAMVRDLIGPLTP